MNALIFLVPEDIVDVRPRLVRPIIFFISDFGLNLCECRSSRSSEA